MPQTKVSNPAKVVEDEKFDGPFHAYGIMHSSNSSEWPTIAVLYFANVDACKQWWELFSNLVKDGKMNSSLWNDKTVLKHGLQWYAWPSTSSPFHSMKDLEKHNDMAAVRGKWSFKCVRSDNGDGFPNLTALQNSEGWPRRQEFQYSVPAHLSSQTPETDTQAAILKALERMNDSLEAIQANLGSSRAISTTQQGANWDDGKVWGGGVASYAIVENAYQKAKELKDRGDTRSFSMIFAQLSMELRRKVGT